MQMINALVETQHKNNLKVIMTLVRRKHYIQFLTSDPNFRGFSWPPWPGFPEPLRPACDECLTYFKFYRSLTGILLRVTDMQNRMIFLFTW